MQCKSVVTVKVQSLLKNIGELFWDNSSDSMMYSETSILSTKKSLKFCAVGFSYFALLYCVFFRPPFYPLLWTGLVIFGLGYV